MIDVVHPQVAGMTEHFVYWDTQRSRHSATSLVPETVHGEQAQEDDETAWLQSIQTAGADNVTGIKGLESGSLVVDIGQLRKAHGSSTTKRSAKATSEA
jgi:hypothetical protein